MQKKIILLVLCFFIISSLTEPKGSFISIPKTQTYTQFSFSKSIIGTYYPQFIDYEQTYYNIIIRVFNQTNQQIISKVSFLKKFPSTCDFALYDVDYGYYTKFTQYSIIGECINQNSSLTYSILLYRSGDWQITQGDIQTLTQDQKKCTLGPFQLNTFYYASGDIYANIFKYCSKSQGQPLYKIYSFGQPKPKIVTQLTVSTTLSLPSLSLVDMIPSVCIDRTYNIYLSQNYGIIISNLSIKYLWNIPGGERPYKIKKLCWSNQFAILTQGYVYFIKVQYINSTIKVTTLKKSDKFTTQSTSKCDFFTIGQNAICSIYNGTDTTWYIIGSPTQNFNYQTQIFPNQQFKPFISQQLCSSSSFYYNYSRYELAYNPNNKIDNSLNTDKYILTTNNLSIIYGDIAGFIDGGGSLFVVSRAKKSSTQQTQIYAAYSKTQFDANPKIILNQTISADILGIQFQYENVYKNGYLLPMISVIYSDYTAIQSRIQVFIPTSNTSQDYTLLTNFSMDLFINDIGYLKNLQNSTQKFYYIISTPIQMQAVARLVLTPSSFEFRYPYEFYAKSYSMCSLTTPDNQLLFVRPGQTELTILRAGFRSFNFLVLDGIFTFSQFSEYYVSCAHDGLVFQNRTKKQILFMNSNLQIQSNISGLAFTDIKLTKSLILLQFNDLIRIKQISTGRDIGQFVWNLSDIVTNIHSTGFIHTKDNKYYDFVKDYQHLHRQNNHLKSM